MLELQRCTSLFVRTGLAGLVGLAGSSLAQGDVWVVDDDPGTGPDFATIGEAVQFAGDGDTILVASGNYPGFLIDGKSLTVVADAGADVLIREPAGPGGFFPLTRVSVIGLAADQAVVLKGFRIDPAPTVEIPQPAVFVGDNAGDVWLEDLDVRANSSLFAVFVVDVSEALVVQNSASVAVARSVFRGPDLAAVVNPPLPPTASATGSVVALYDCEFHGSSVPGGGSGQGACSGLGITAGDAFRLSGGSLFAAGCLFEGGNGADGQDAVAPNGAGAGTSGGNGLRVLDAGAVLTTRDCAFVAGAGGTAGQSLPGMPPCPDGDDGAGLLTPGTLLELSGPALPFAVTSPLRIGETGAFSFAGAAGDLALLVVSPSQNVPTLLGSPGSLVVGPVARTFALGTIGPAGVLDLPVLFTTTGTSEFRSFSLQGLVLTSGAELILTSPSSLTILGAGL